MIYLASPYSDPDPAVRQARFEAVCRQAAEMIRSGVVVFSPIAYSHPICTLGGLPGDYATWRRCDEVMLQAVDEVVVLTLPGWERSKGICAEVEAALRLGKKVSYLEPEAHQT